jgi:cytoskeletal protein RodZ
MKRCPKCDFSFADFHHVCDFDGAELVDDPERPPSQVKASSPRRRFWRVLKSPVFLAGLGLVAVLASALLIGYYDAKNQLNPIARNQPSENSSASPVSPPQDSTQSAAQRPAETKAPAASTRALVASNPKRTERSSSKARRQGTASRQLARLHSPGSARKQPNKSLTARQKESKDAADSKEPKLTAMLKTTWHILRKPFRF